MKTKEIVELMLKSSDHNPYTGMISKKDNLIAAIDLAKLCKDFADKGQMDEAMNIESEQWVVVISILKTLSEDCLVMSVLVGYNDFQAVVEINDGDTDLDIMNKFVEIAKNNSIEDVSNIKLDDITIDDVRTVITVGSMPTNNDE